MRLLLSNNKHVETKIGWKHGVTSNQPYRPEASLTGGEASPADSSLSLAHYLLLFSHHTWLLLLLLFE
jgi:hypothetical protein